MALSLLDFASQFPQNPMMAGFIKKFTAESVFGRVLNFIPVDGFAYQYGEEATPGAVYYRALNETYPDTGYSVVNPKTEVMPIFGGTIKTDIQLVNKQGGAARSNEIARKTRAASLFYDHEIINGDGATNPKAMTGLQARLTGDQLLQDDVNSGNGGPLTLAMLDALVDAVYGRPDQKVLLMNVFCRRKLKQLLVAAAGGATVADLGNMPMEYDGVRIELFDENETEHPVLDFDEDCGTSHVTTSIYCIHPGSTTDKEGLQGLTGSNGVTHVDCGPHGTYHEDLVEAHMGIGLFHPRAAARLKGITKA